MVNRRKAHTSKRRQERTIGRMAIVRLRGEAIKRLDSVLKPPGHYDRGLDASANSHAETWRRGVPGGDADHYDHHEAYKLQACLIYLYNPTQEYDLDHNYFVAQRYLTFLASSRLMAGGCPLDNLRGPLAELLVRLTVEQARQFDAYLRFKRRVPESEQTYSADKDYLDAAQLLNNAFSACNADCTRYPSCFTDLRRSNRVGRARAFRKVEGPFETRHLVVSRVAESGEVRRADAEAFIKEFYGWIDSENGADVSEATAAKLLRYFAEKPQVVTILELTTRCFLRRVLQDRQRCQSTRLKDEQVGPAGDAGRIQAHGDKASKQPASTQTRLTKHGLLHTSPRTH
jgi:hypothetical protein